MPCKASSMSITDYLYKVAIYTSFIQCMCADTHTSIMQIWQLYKALSTHGTAVDIQHSNNYNIQ